MSDFGLRNPGNGIDDSDTNIPDEQGMATKPTAPPRKLSTAFNAYPLEYSSNFLGHENEVIFMPTGPTDLPLSVSPTVGSQHLPSHFGVQSGNQPVCHGFFFPVSRATIPVQEQQQQNRVPDSVYNYPSESDSFPHDNTLLPSLESGVETRLLILLLQQLISLQLTGRLSSDNISDMVPKPDETQGVIPPVNQQSFTPAFGSTRDAHQEMHTYLVPVEARLQDHEGLAFHVTPRNPVASPSLNTEDAKLTMECTTDRLVLYPYPTLEKSPFDHSTESAVDSKIMESANSPAAALTLNDIKDYIRRGSLGAAPNQRTDFVKDIKGHAKPGFALLSIRQGSTVQDQTQAPRYIVKSYSTEENLVNSDIPEHCSQECPAALLATISKKGNKRKQRFHRSNTDPQKRSGKRNGRISTTSAPNIDKVNDMLDTRQITVSRFRVSRFADKKQAWLAPLGSGCFVVHDLWTTKLPEYVLKHVGESKKVIIDSSGIASSSNHVIYLEDKLGTECSVCQSTLPWEGRCEHEEYCSSSQNSGILSTGLSVYNFMHAVFEWTPNVPRWLHSSIDWCCQSNVWCPEMHPYGLST